jgi:outer membrane lipoprotein-sorting protein
MLSTTLIRITSVFLMAFSATSLCVWAADDIPAELNDTLGVYRQSESMILEVRKTVKNSMLDKETTFKGMIRFVKGKFYWETSDPEKNLVIYDLKTLWTIQYPPAEFKDMPLQVAKMSMKSKKNSPIILAEIFGTRPINSVFKVKLKSKNGALMSYDLTEKKSQFGLKNLTLKIDAKAQRVVSIEYVDEVENETKIEFRSTQFNIKVKSSLFNYKPPKNAQVTEY